MALIKCPECGKEISDAAESCPNCGYPIKGQQQIGDSDGLGKGQETKKLKTVLFIVVGIILVVIVCGGSLLFKKGGLIDKLTDKEAPKFENVPTELTFNVDDDVKFNDIVKEKNIKVTDNVDTDIEIKIDSSQVKLDVPGKYLITLSARDKAKNIGKVEVPVYVNDYETHKEYLAAITLEKSKLDKSSSGSYQYEGITVPDSEVNNIEAGTMYRSISRQLEGFYLFGNMIYKNWNTEIASTVFGIDKPESYDDMKPYVDSVFSYITPDATLPQILSWIQECTTVSGEFDYEKANFSFEITDLTATAKEMHITEKMLGYVLAVIDEYGPEENFKGNSYSCKLQVKGDAAKEEKNILTYDDFNATLDGVSSPVSSENMKESLDGLGEGSCRWAFFDKNVDEYKEGIISTSRGVRIGMDYNSVIYEYGKGMEGDVNFSDSDTIIHMLNDTYVNSQDDSIKYYKNQAKKYTAYGNYILTVDAVRRCDWLNRFGEDEQPGKVAILLEMDIQNQTYDDPYNDFMFIDSQIIVLDENNYSIQSWGTGYDDGEYHTSPKIPVGTNGKLVIPYIVDDTCNMVTITFNNQYKIVAQITG